jgi:hypothetical protein
LLSRINGYESLENETFKLLSLFFNFEKITKKFNEMPRALVKGILSKKNYVDDFLQKLQLRITINNKSYPLDRDNCKLLLILIIQ